MQRARMTRCGQGSKAILLAMALSLLSTQAGWQQACAKRPSFLVPPNEKLDDGSGPQTNDGSQKPESGTTDGDKAADAAAPSDGDKSAGAAPANLTPLTLSGDAPAPTTTTTSTAGVDSKGMIKATVTQTQFMPKGPVDPSGKSLIHNNQGISDKLNNSLSKKAKDLSLSPTQLLVTDEEAAKTNETMADAEKEQLGELWESALSRSPDIQFVIQKLMPNSSPGHGASLIMRALSVACYGGMGAMQMMMPNAGGYMLSGTGGSAVMNLLNVQEGKIAKNARLSQTEGIMLYNMVRTTADKLVDNFRNYKKNLAAMQKASTDLQDLQGMVSEAKAGQDSAKQLEMEYTIRRQQRDVDGLNEDLRRYRQGLVDLSGPEAVAKLDQEIADEQNKVNQVIAAPTSSPAPSPDQSATPSQKQETAEKPQSRG